MPALLLCCLPASVIRAESSGGEARLTSARIVEVTPGKIVTASLLAANRSSAEALYDEKFALPPGWLRISPPASPLLLQAGEQKLRLIAFAVPTTSPAGSFELTYVLTNSRNQSATATAAVTVVVLPVVKLDLVREDQVDTVIAGDIFEPRLRLINRGNSRLKISIEAVSAPAAPVRLEPAEIWVDAASSQPVRAAIQTDIGLQKPTPQVINLKATAVGPDGALVTATQSAVINLIPRITGDRDPYVRLPAQIRLIAAAEDGRAGAQAEFSGSGFLDENRKHHLEFLFRGPSLERASLFGLRNEYRVSYSGAKLDLQLGDQNYSLSPLTQRFNYGRGAAVVFHPGPTSAGAFYMQTMERVRDFQTAGAYIRREFSPAFSVQANALYKSESGLAQQTGPLGLFSIQPHFSLGKKLALDLEYAVSTGASGGAAHAHRAEARGLLFEDFTYSVERVHAGDKFFGYYHGTENTQAAVTFPIFGPLRGRASFNQEARDATAESTQERPLPAGIFATRQTAYRPGLLLRVSPRTDVSLDYQNIEQHAAMLAGPHASLEHSARLGIGHSRGKFSVQTFAELGVVDKTGPIAPGVSVGRETVERYSAFFSYRPTPRQSYSIFGTIGSAGVLDLTERSQTMGASAQWSISNRLSAGLNYARNDYNSRTARVQDTAAGTIGYTQANRNTVAVQGRWIKDSTTQRSGTSVMVSYTIPFGLRAAKKKNGGTIRGRVFEVQGDVSLPMSRVVVTANGITAVTDRHGHFIFPALNPGLYQVNIEQRSLGVDRVTLAPVPLTVEVGKGGVVELSIGVVRATRVSAKITVFAAPRRTLAPAAGVAVENKLTPAGGLAAGLVELTNGTQVLRQTTDRDGEVSFEQLRPGKWTLRVYQNNLPDHHAIETPEVELELKPGEPREVLVRVIPKVRQIRFIDEGVIAPSVRQ